MKKTSRRSLLAGSLCIGLVFYPGGSSAQSGEPTYSLPIGIPGQVIGDGFLIRHGFACENTWYNPGWWHTAEDWYLLEGNTAGAGVYAVSNGEVVFAGSEYPGRVVIVRHADDLYSMYGHLDHALAVTEGDVVVRGQRLGSVFDRADSAAPSHLHFEVRTFLTMPEINGNAPRYDVGCGFACPPGPGYWPIDAPEHPSVIGWRNPTHVIANRMYEGRTPAGAEVVVASGAPGSTQVWSLPANRRDAKQAGDVELAAGDRYPLLGIAAGPEDSTSTSAEGYRLWYQLELADGPGWIRAVETSSEETGSDGRTSSIRFTLLPAAQPV